MCFHFKTLRENVGGLENRLLKNSYPSGKNLGSNKVDY